MVRILYILLLYIGVLNAQTYPIPINLDDVSTENYSPPTNMPQYLVPFINEQGNTVTRVSDIDVFGVDSQQLGHNYSKDQPWNKDGSLIMLSDNPYAILNGNTYEFLGFKNLPSYARWSNTEPNYVYGTSGNAFVKHNVLTNARETLRTFNEFSNIDFGYGEGNQSNDDKYVALIGDNDTFIIYDIDNDSYVTKEIPNGDLDWFSVTPLGNYAIASWKNTGSEINEGLKRYTIDLIDVIHLYDYTAHGDLGLMQNNDEVYVQYGDTPQWSTENYITMTYIESGITVNLFNWSNSIHGNSGIWGGHVSMRSDRKGIAYISEECCEDHETLPSEQFALHLDGSNKIERFGRQNSERDLNNNGSLGDDAFYLHSARTVPNRDGTKIMFVSNWHNAHWQSNNSGYAFILEVPQEK